jgi:hypothetical protein
MTLMRHRREKFLFYPSDVETWAADDQAWLRSDYETSGMLSVDVAMNNLAGMYRSCAPLLSKLDKLVDSKISRRKHRMMSATRQKRNHAQHDWVPEPARLRGRRQGLT